MYLDVNQRIVESTQYYGATNSQLAPPPERSSRFKSTIKMKIYFLEIKIKSILDVYR